MSKTRGNRKQARQQVEESVHEDDDHHITDQQKDEEGLIRHTFAFYQTNRQGAQIERYELPMLLDGKSHSSLSFPFFSPFEH